MKRSLAIASAGIVAIIVGALATTAIGSLVFISAMMMFLPHSPWQGPFIIAGFAVFFLITFSIVFREMLEKFTR